MKKLLLCLAVSVMGAGTAMAQDAVISILGGSTTVDWAGDLDMATEDGITYTYENLVIEVPSDEEGQPDPGVKFRKDHDWGTNWGGNGFPAGTASQGGSNIPATNGTYDVTFNINTLQYTFAPAGVEFDVVEIMIGEMTMAMVTGDGIHYMLEAIDFEANTDFSFIIDGEEWGNVGFPDGTAVEGGAIPVLANMYNITFNLETKAYRFDFVTISMVGIGVFPDDETWNTDLDLTTTDGVNYSIASFAFPGGEGKFRLNHKWGTSWGSTEFPAGTATTDGGNMNITAGTYSVAFNRETGAFAFAEPTAGIVEFAKNGVKAWPNPSQNQWNFTAPAAISAISVTDISGKVVFSGIFNAANAVVDASGMASGIYFAQVISGNGTQVIKVIKN